MTATMPTFNLYDFEKAIQNAPTEEGAFLDAAPLEETPKDSYFKQDGYLTRSQLLRFSAILAGKEPREFKGAFEKGRMFDAYFTERQSFSASKCSAWDLLQIHKAEHALQSYAGVDADFVQYIGGNRNTASIVCAKHQHAVYRNRFQAGEYFVKFKIKSDFEFETRGGQKVCVDLKSTTKQDLASFINDIKTHQLDLQAAIYTDVGRYDRFLFVGISYLNEHTAQKAFLDASLKNALLAPSKVFVVELSQRTIQRARERYLGIIENSIKKSLYVLD